MIKIRLIAIGDIKEQYLRDAIDEYTKRLRRYCTYEIIELKEGKDTDIPRKKKLEAEAILSKVRGYMIALDGSGREVSSEGLSEMLGDLADRGIGEITFVIGGSNGLDNSVRERADYILSFGKMTFPHQLFRVMVSEQIYRAFTIRAGTPYHK